MSSEIPTQFKNKAEKLDYLKEEIAESARLNLQRAQNITLITSLVKYDTPFLVSSSTNKKTIEDLNQNEEQCQLFLREIIENSGNKDFTYSVRDALNKILPPKKIKENEKTWVQYVTSCPVSKGEVLNLQEGLDQKLLTEKARETGICPIREKLYDECFDELIRQVTLNCLERGILLSRIKKESEMTVSSYQTLYESSVAYGIRTLLLAEEEKKKINDNIEKVESECEVLENEINNIIQEIEEMDRKDKERREEEKNKHEEEILEGRKKANAFKEKLKEKLTFHGK